MAIEKLKMFCIYDCKMELYLSPFTAINSAVAIRIFESAVIQEGHDFNIHPDDYGLWEIGTFDQESAAVEPTASRNIVQAHHIISKYRNLRDEVTGGV